MPDYTIYQGDSDTGSTETVADTGGAYLYGPPTDGARDGNQSLARGCYIRQDATTYRWIYDEPQPTTKTSWTAE